MKLWHEVREMLSFMDVPFSILYSYIHLVTGLHTCHITGLFFWGGEGLGVVTIWVLA